ncbi:40_t:CDS:2 [Paraglomus occultum]|uniref:40_t:CDS:1 n=1 Tax=Paraglomus occultum TaxID=144539 RepID=A0A9N8ZGB0_9GLOM|nr:40_t:CDS:2 [Paraglomus occultum]
MLQPLQINYLTYPSSSYPLFPSGATPDMNNLVTRPGHNPFQLTERNRRQYFISTEVSKFTGICKRWNRLNQHLTEKNRQLQSQVRLPPLKRLVMVFYVWNNYLTDPSSPYPRLHVKIRAQSSICYSLRPPSMCKHNDPFLYAVPLRRSSTPFLFLHVAVPPCRRSVSLWYL